jgi:hypothetical protein
MPNPFIARFYLVSIRYNHAHCRHPFVPAFPSQINAKPTTLDGIKLVS